MWVQGGTSRSKHIEAIPIALSSPNSEPEPTQSVLSLSVTPFNVATTHPLKKKNADSSCLHFRSSGTCGAWTWTKTSRLSTPCRKGPWRSRTAGRFPSRESLSSSAWCTPRPASAPACRSWSRNDGRSSSPPHSRTNADKGRPRVLTREVKRI